MAKKVVSAVRPRARDLSRDGQIDNLKTLNTRLIEETIERRKQVAQLQSELAELYLVDSIERDVFQLVLSSTVARLEVDLAAERAAVAETVGVLQMKVESAAAALGATEMCLLAAAGEKDLIMREVEDKRIETGNLGAECANLQNEVREMEGRVGLVIQENASLKICIDEKISLVDKSGRDLLKCKEMLKLKEAEIEILNADKKAYDTKVSALKEECHHLKAVQRKLEDETSRYKCLVDELKEDELGWRMKYEEMDKSHLTVGKELSDIRIQLGQLEKEKFKNEKTFHLKFEEMISLIDNLKGNIAKAEAEKDVLDQRRVELEIDSCNLKNELVELHSVRKSLEDANLAYSEANAKVEDVNVAAQNQLKLEEENTFLTLQVEKLLENKHFLGRKCEQLQVDFNRGTSENREKSRQIDSLLASNASLEKKLEMTFGQVLSLVRNIAAVEAQENQYRITEEKMEYDEMIQSLEKELEAIKFALKSRNTKIEDLNRELLRISMVDAQKSKGGLWKWLCPATTTIVASVSLAYAARAR